MDAQTYTASSIESSPSRLPPFYSQQSFLSFSDDDESNQLKSFYPPRRPEPLLLRTNFLTRLDTSHDSSYNFDPRYPPRHPSQVKPPYRIGEPYPRESGNHIAGFSQSSHDDMVWAHFHSPTPLSSYGSSFGFDYQRRIAKSEFRIPHRSGPMLWFDIAWSAVYQSLKRIYYWVQERSAASLRRRTPTPSFIVGQEEL
jgi:hypothetical protein